MCIYIVLVPPPGLQQPSQAGEAEIFTYLPWMNRWNPSYHKSGSWTICLFVSYKGSRQPFSLWTRVVKKFYWSVVLLPWFCIKVYNSGIMTVLLWTEFPLFQEVVLGGVRQVTLYQGVTPAGNAQCAAFHEHGAGCPLVQFIAPERRCQGNPIRHYSIPLIEFGQVVLWVPYCFSGSRKCNINWWDAHSKYSTGSTVLSSSQSERLWVGLMLVTLCVSRVRKLGTGDSWGTFMASKTVIMWSTQVAGLALVLAGRWSLL